MSAGKKKGSKPKKKKGGDDDGGLSKGMAKLSLKAKGRATTAAAQTKDWVPQKTYVIIMALGLNDWADDDDPEWDRSQTLWQFFVDSGVPEDDNMLWLDDEGSTEEHLEELADFIADTEEGSLLLFYYAGHGDRQDDELTFCHPSDDGVTLSALLDIIENEFWGSHAVLFADCCFSGVVARTVAELQSDVAYAALTSSTDDITSTGNWTFTDCLLSALSGDQDIDADGDGAITLQELADHVIRQMKKVDAQPADWSFAPNFNPDLRIATCSKLKAKASKKDKKAAKKAKKAKKAKQDDEDEDDGEDEGEGDY